MPELILSVTYFIFGIVIGSFLNVCIYRIPKKENIVVVRSHCMECNYQLKWYDLVPVFSYIFLKGKCRKCACKLSAQYPIIEALNGALYVLVFIVKGANVESLLYCLLFSALLALSVIDFRTFEIPVGFNYFIAILGIAKLILNYRDWINYLIGAVSVSGFLLLLYLITHGRAIGGGDIKLMAACGLVLGWKEIILAFCIGCIVGAVFHVVRMKVSGAEKVLAMGPYLSLGVGIAALWGSNFIIWYLSTLGI